MVTLVTLVDLGRARNVAVGGDHRILLPINRILMAKVTTGTRAWFSSRYPSAALAGREHHCSWHSRDFPSCAELERTVALFSELRGDERYLIRRMLFWLWAIGKASPVVIVALDGVPYLTWARTWRSEKAAHAGISKGRALKYKSSSKRAGPAYE
jgi:hypothetical protein